MFAKVLGLRAEDRRDTAVAFFTLLAVMMGHSMLETARDALFLAKLPASKLPWAYLLIALLALAVTSLNRRAVARFAKRRALSGTLAGGAMITAALYWSLSRADQVALFAIYVWSGLLATVVVVQFWLLLADALDVAQAKRAFAVIGAGGLVGAAGGSAAAGGLLVVAQPQTLLLFAAGMFALASSVPLCFTHATKREGKRRRVRDTSRRPGWHLVRGDRYLVRLFALVVVSTLLVTGVDFVFKTVVSQRLAPGDLGRFFAAYYATLNTIALVVQLFIAPRLLRTFGVNGAVLLLPGLLLLGSLGCLLAAGLVPVLLLKGIDGALRHSLNRTSTEILYLPLPPEIRDRFKGFVEALGHRGGQAVASVLILGALAAGAEPMHLAGVLLLLAVGWLGVAVGLKPLYLELFRRQLRDGRVDTEVDVPDLDLHAMEALLSALSSDDDNEVIGALDLFEQHGKTNLLPALILYHPSREVVLRALKLFEDQDRNDVMRLSGRLLEHVEPEIRAAALHLNAMLRPDEVRLREFARSDQPDVAVAAYVELVVAGFAGEDEATEKFRTVVEGRSTEDRLALARVFRHLPDETYGWVASDLANLGLPDVAVEVARSITAVPHPQYLPLLVRMLEHRATRTDARDALLAIGEPALLYLDRALADPTLPRGVRRHLPRTVSRFPGKMPAQVLLDRLPRETDEQVELKILRGVGRMRSDDPSIPVKKKQLIEVASKNLKRAVTMINWRLTVQQMMKVDDRARTDAAEILLALLVEKESSALERTFRTLGVLQPREEFRMIYDGLASGDSRARAGSIELLEHVVPDPVRGALLALVDDLGDEDRLKNSALLFDPPGRKRRLEIAAEWSRADGDRQAALAGAVRSEYAARLREMLKDPGDVVRSIASYHIAELGLDELRQEVEGAAEERDSSVLGAIQEGAVDLFRRPELSGVS